MSVWNHRFAGFLFGLTLRLRSEAKATELILDLDRWAYEREWIQNWEGENPNDPMSEHQIAEAKAWGLGARAARGIDPPFPSPPYA